MLRLIEKSAVVDHHPAFCYCHASTVELFEGDPIVCWFGGAFEAASDSSIWCARLQDGTWSPARRLFGGENIPLWNPVLYHDGKKLQLYYKSGPVIAHWDTWQATAAGELCFGKPFEFAPKSEPGDVRGSSRNKPLRTSSGRLLMPGSVEGEFNRVFIEYSDDNGITWQKGEEMFPAALDDSQIGVKNESILVTPQSFAGRGVIQPTLWESAPGKIHALMRSTETVIFRSDSEDDGITWSPLYDSGLPGNNSGIDLVRLPDGRIILAYNPVRKNWGERTPLVLDVSEDNGKTWTRVWVLEDTPGEYSYPAIIYKENKLYVTYTANRKAIMFCAFEVE